jgi:hypothetical protein
MLPQHMSNMLEHAMPAPAHCSDAGSVLTAGCLAAIGAVMALSVPVSVTPGSTQQPGKQLPLLVALLSIYSVVAEASIGGLSITGTWPTSLLFVRNTFRWSCQQVWTSQCGCVDMQDMVSRHAIGVASAVLCMHQLQLPSSIEGSYPGG